MATLRKKKYYRSHIANLRLGLELGYKIIRVHRGIRFRQKPFMKNYVEKLARLRKENMNVPSLCEFFKLLMNSLFGKTCENPENYRKFRISNFDKSSDESENPQYE
jgi:hypothetical protein